MNTKYKNFTSKFLYCQCFKYILGFKSHLSVRKYETNNQGFPYKGEAIPVLLWKQIINTCWNNIVISVWYQVKFANLAWILKYFWSSMSKQLFVYLYYFQNSILNYLLQIIHIFVHSQVILGELFSQTLWKENNNSPNYMFKSTCASVFCWNLCSRPWSHHLHKLIQKIWEFLPVKSASSLVEFSLYEDLDSFFTMNMPIANKRYQG